MEVVIEESDAHDNAFAITSNGAEVLDGAVQHHGPAIIAYGQILGNIVARSNKWISEHRNWLANLPRRDTDEETPASETPEQSPLPTITSTARHGPITSPPNLNRRQEPPFNPFNPIGGLSLCAPPVASAVASVSAEAAAQLQIAQQSAAIELQTQEQNAAQVIEALRRSLDSALAALQGQKTAAPPPPAPPLPLAPPAQVPNTVTYVLTTTISAPPPPPLEPLPPLTNVITSVYTTTASAPPPLLEPPPPPLTNTVVSTLYLTTTVNMPMITPSIPPPPTTVLSTITITFSDGQVATTVPGAVPGGGGGGGGGGGANPSNPSLESSLVASAIAGASAAISSANDARASVSLELAQAQNSLSSLASQATLLPDNAGKIVETPTTFALIVVFSSLGTAFIAVLIFFWLLTCCRKRREKKQGLGMPPSRDSQETMFRRVTDDPVISPYDPTGFARERKRSVSRGRPISREIDDMGRIVELPPGLPGNIVGFLVDESRSASRAPTRNEMRERSRSSPPLDGDSPTRGRSMVDPVPLIRQSPQPPPLPRQTSPDKPDRPTRSLSRKNTLIYDPDRPNSPPMFGNTFTERLSRLSKLDMTAVPGPLNQNKSTISTPGPYTPIPDSTDGQPTRAFTFLDTEPHETKLTTLSVPGTPYSTGPLSLPFRSPNRSSFNRLSTIPSLGTMPNTNRSTMVDNARDSDVLTIGLEIERGTSPSVYSVNAFPSRELKGKVEEGERLTSSKGVIENVNGQVGGDGEED
ncbi:hypothetical protein HYFRA_00007551 [Hymenoscyphus fraxineus]|uniref:Transmembrane protein n=1 Tax=Hymenoscyphus fraxineus TaxID=746836 RepID=A0A9N9PRX1_9HELO|nr:hypothetical protein HYFRA_00007551 [Hymenoscyphus fraxineus]